MENLKEQRGQKILDGLFLSCSDIKFLCLLIGTRGNDTGGGGGGGNNPSTSM